MLQHALELPDDAVGEVPLGEALRQGLVVVDDLLRRLVLLVQLAQQPVELKEIVEDVGADEERLRDRQMLRQVRVGDLRRAVQDLPGEHQAGGLAADLAAADAPPADFVQVGDAEELARDTDEAQLVADHGFDQHDFDLLQVVLELDLLLGRQRLVLFAAGKEHIPRRQFRVDIY